MRIFSFLNENHEIIAVVKAESHKKSLKKVKDMDINKKTPYFSEPVKESLYYTF